MTDSPTPIAGWYPDPAGQGRIQWWDGSQWTENFAEPAASAQPQPQSPAPAPAAHAPAAYTPAAYTPYGAATYGAADPYNVMAQKPTAPEGTRPYTPFIWALAALPVVNIVFAVISWTAFTPDPDSLSSGPSLLQGSGLGSYTVTFVIAALSILFALLDYRALTRAGVPKPFHWAWIFFALINIPVYIIGRSVVVRRRTGSGLAPMFLYLGLWVAAFVVSSIFAAIMVAPLLDQMSQP